MTDDTVDIAATLRGDGAAFERIMKRHQQRIGTHMWRFTRDHMVYEELVADVFVAAYLNLRSYRAEAPFVHWLMALATRVGYRHWKAQARTRSRGHVRLEEHRVPGADSGAAGIQEAADEVHFLLAALPPRDRLVLTLIYLEGCTVDEAARLAGWSRTMTKVQAHRARKKLEALVRLRGDANESWPT
jgi:RNA polymerase sigma-70 factor (ECF subfamily)